MTVYGTINPNDYTVENYSTTAEIQWTLVSASNGLQITYPAGSPELTGSITINRAKKQKDDSFNVDTGTYEYVLHASVKHLFYNNNTFVSASKLVTSSIFNLTDDLFVFSIGQELYGNKIEPSSFEVTIHPLSSSIIDDGYGNLFVSQSGTGSWVGNIFYEKGIAVVQQDTGSINTNISRHGLKLIQGSSVDVFYNSNVTVERHEIITKLKPTEFNFSAFNPSILTLYSASGESASNLKKNNVPQVSENEWYIYDLLSSGFITPYVTTVGLYNDERDLVAVAKLSRPIQRTFSTEQIFIIRFDVE